MALLDIKFAKLNPFSEWVDINRVSTDFRITVLNHTLDHSFAFRNPNFFIFLHCAINLNAPIYIYKLNFLGFSRRRVLEIVENFDNCLGVYRDGTRRWFNEFVYLFWDQCYVLLTRSLLPKLRFVFIHVFDCLPLENGSVYLYDSPLYV